MRKLKLRKWVKVTILLMIMVIISMILVNLIQERISELENNKDAFNNRSIVLVNPNK